MTIGGTACGVSVRAQDRAALPEMCEPPRISSTDLFDEFDERLARFEVEFLPDQQLVDLRRQMATANVKYPSGRRTGLSHP
jgi:hypothetical protein